jgi:ribosomal protein L11 methyltransferase
VADIIMRLTENVKDFMYDDSLFICSGIIDIRKDEVEKNLIDSGFEIVETLTIENWYAYAAKIKTR